jgi:HAD superfamily hydrolase (TIGR01549 family)
MPTTDPRLRYDAVIFDVGGTLIGFRGAAFMREFLAEAGLPAAQEDARELNARLMEAIRSERESAVGLGADEASLLAWWRAVFARTWPDRPDLAQEMYRSLREGRLDRVHPDTRPALEGLRGMGVQLGVVSNFATRLEAVLEGLGLRDFFSFLIVSSKVGLAKPDRRIFDLAVDCVGRPRERLLYVGDHFEDDIEGARGAGLDAVLIDRESRQPHVPCPRIASLLELVDYVR